MKQSNALPKQSNILRNTLVRTLLLAVFFSVIFITPASSNAETAQEIQQKIAEQNSKIAALEKEIAEYERTLESIGGTKKTLQGEINRIDLSRKKIGTDISITENRTITATLELKRLGGAIVDKASRIETSTKTIAKSLRTLNQLENSTTIEYFLTANGLMEAWIEADRVSQLGLALRNEIVDLQDTKVALTADYSETEKKRATLLSLKRELAGQKLLLDQNRKEQQSLLSVTKNKESEYQKILAAKLEAKAAFEKELTDFEASLKFTLDPNTIPRAGSGVLTFPIDPSFMARCKDRVKTFGNAYCLTQFFGYTDFAKSGAYQGSQHNGIDFGVPEGTKIVAALSGVVEATGNTDASRGCYSYGKWVLVRHGNGLSTLYAHLSVISVSEGSNVTTGSLIGYSGKTGYATGPHLHFTLYASNAVSVIRMKDIPGRTAKTACDNMYVPVSSKSGYLDPYSYL